MSSADDIDWSEVDDEDWHGEAAAVENRETDEDVAVGTEPAESGSESSESDGAPSVGAVDWAAAWDNCNVPRDRHLSPTQLAAAFLIAHAAGSATREDQRRLCEEAVDAGVLHVERTVVHTHDEHRELVVRSYELPPEVRDD